MQPELITTTYEAIDNPILRLLVYFLAAAVIALTSAVVYLFKKYISLSEESIKTLGDLNNTLENIVHIKNS